VASGSILLKDVPANSIVVGVPGRVVYRDGQKISNEVPDIEAEAIKSLKEHIARLEQDVKRISSLVESKNGKTEADSVFSEGVDQAHPIDPSMFSCTVRAFRIYRLAALISGHGSKQG